MCTSGCRLTLCLEYLCWNVWNIDVSGKCMDHFHYTSNCIPLFVRENNGEQKYWIEARKKMWKLEKKWHMTMFERLSNEKWLFYGIRVPSQCRMCHVHFSLFGVHFKLDEHTATCLLFHFTIDTMNIENAKHEPIVNINKLHNTYRFDVKVCCCSEFRRRFEMIWFSLFYRLVLSSILCIQ